MSVKDDKSREWGQTCWRGQSSASPGATLSPATFESPASVTAECFRSPWSVHHNGSQMNRLHELALLANDSCDQPSHIRLEDSRRWRESNGQCPATMHLRSWGSHTHRSNVLSNEIIDPACYSAVEDERFEQCGDCLSVVLPKVHLGRMDVAGRRCCLCHCLQ